MLHLVDRFMALELGEPLDPPIVEHPVVEPILVDGGELVLERFVEVLDDLVVALHLGLLKHRAERWFPVFGDDDATTKNSRCPHNAGARKKQLKNGGFLRKIAC